MVDTMQMMSTILNEIIIMKHKLNSPVSIEMCHQVILITTIVQITFQMDRLTILQCFRFHNR